MAKRSVNNLHSGRNRALIGLGVQFFLSLIVTAYAGAYCGETQFADVNGDGKADAIAVNSDGVAVRLSDGTKFLPHRYWTAAYYGDRGSFFADVNGDGKADAIVVNGDGVAVRLSDGTQFLPHQYWTDGAYYGDFKTFFADVNGDGKADAIVVNGDGVAVRLSDGTQFLWHSYWTEGGYYGDIGTTFFADVSGDGKADAIVLNLNGVIVRVSDGTKFLPPTNWTNGAIPYSNFGDPAYFADINGDGEADLITITHYPSYGGTFNAGVKLSYVDKFLPQYYGGVLRYNHDIRDTFFVDVTGDGRSDWIIVDSKGVAVFPSTGLAFDFPKKPYWTNGAFYGDANLFCPLN